MAIEPVSIEASATAKATEPAVAKPAKAIASVKTAESAASMESIEAAAVKSSVVASKAAAVKTSEAPTAVQASSTPMKPAPAVRAAETAAMETTSMASVLGKTGFRQDYSCERQRPHKRNPQPNGSVHMTLQNRSDVLLPEPLLTAVSNGEQC
jgi:hypothetical protein